MLCLNKIIIMIILQPSATAAVMGVDTSSTLPVFVAHVYTMMV